MDGVKEESHEDIDKVGTPYGSSRDMCHRSSLDWEASIQCVDLLPNVAYNLSPMCRDIPAGIRRALSNHGRSPTTFPELQCV